MRLLGRIAEAVLTATALVKAELTELRPSASN